MLLQLLAGIGDDAESSTKKPKNNYRDEKLEAQAEQLNVRQRSILVYSVLFHIIHPFSTPPKQPIDYSNICRRTATNHCSRCTRARSARWTRWACPSPSHIPLDFQSTATVNPVTGERRPFHRDIDMTIGRLPPKLSGTAAAKQLSERAGALASKFGHSTQQKYL